MHAVLQRYFLAYLLFGTCFEFPSLSLSTIVHLTRAEYHNNSYSQEKRGGVRHAGVQCNTAVIILAVYYRKNDLVASKQRANKEQYMKNEVK